MEYDLARRVGVRLRLIGRMGAWTAVSYTHLDVYKRQEHLQLISLDVDLDEVQLQTACLNKMCIRDRSFF